MVFELCDPAFRLIPKEIPFNLLLNEFFFSFISFFFQVSSSQPVKFQLIDATINVFSSVKFKHSL